MTNTIVIAENLMGGERGAEFCDNDCHRYRLWRIWDPTTQPMMFVMLNPSVADHNIVDKTVRRCIGYAQTWGYGGLYVGNVYGYRATDRDEMAATEDPVGRDNDDALAAMAALSALIVVGWGTYGDTVPGRAAEVLALLREHGPGQVHALVTTDGGHPGHPLYLDKTLKPVLYER